MKSRLVRLFLCQIENMEIKKAKRNFVSDELVITEWSVLQPYFKNLIDRPINNVLDLKQWLSDRSELDAIIEEDEAWRYIRMTIETANEAYQEHYRVFVSDIQPEIAPLDHQLNEKLVRSPYLDELKEDSAYAIYFRSIVTAIELFREENVALDSFINEKSQEFGKLSGAQSIEMDGNTLTMQQASQYLKDPNEQIRKSVFEKMSSRRLQDRGAFDELYTVLIQKRHEVAKNAGFENYSDYKFKALGRFDYTKADCIQFHETIKTVVVPVVREIQQRKLTLLGKDLFKPWDHEVDPEGKLPLAPFKNGEELLNGTIHMLNELDPYFADCLQTMQQMGYLDLDSKPGKAPGGYNYPLYEIGIPFIFMNAVGAQRDVVTMVHESGHAVHSFLSRDLALTGFKNLPSEVAELASMSMELLTMDLWSAFYANEHDLKRAKREQFESIITILPWIAQIDEFQHWVYEFPNHSAQERTDKWLALSAEYGSGLTDWSGYEEVRATSWQKQMHLFEVPFYYIEYGIAQLGALGIWKNSIHNSTEAIAAYKNALKLGYTVSIPEIYATAGVKFDFSEKYISSLINEVQSILSNY